MTISEANDVFVHARFAGGRSQIVGRYRVIRNAGARPYGEFQYVGSWLRNEHGLSFALDPENLPLAPDAFRAEQRLLMPGALSDATPDRWGQKVLEASLPQDQLPLAAPALLLATNSTRVGCLAFSRKPAWVDVEGAYASVADLQPISEAFEKLDQGIPLEGLASAIWNAGTSLGGARPKATVMQNDELWIAKFQRRDDLFDQCSIEHATMRLAAECRITVAETRIVDVGPRKAVLVKRFDRVRDVPSCHYLSAMSALGVDDTSDAGSYGEIAHFLARYAADHRKDRHELFRRMAFNVMCGNRDDHLKNHAMIMDHGGAWRLSPAFDIVPQPDFEPFQAIGVGQFGGMPTVSNCLSKVGDFDLGVDDARAIIAEMAGIIRPWREKFAQWGVPAASIQRMQKAFSSELEGA